MTKKLTPEQREKQNIYFKAYRKKWNAENNEKVIEYKRNFRKRWPHSILLYQAKTRAKKRGLEFNLTAEDIKVPEFCPVLGIPLVPNVGGGGASKYSPSIDRIDNTKGYTKDNIIVVSYRANSIKNAATPTEIRMVADFYERLSNVHQETATQHD